MKYYSIKEVAEITKVSTKTIRNHIDKGYLKVEKNMYSGRVLVSEEALKAYVDNMIKGV